MKSKKEVMADVGRVLNNKVTIQKYSKPNNVNINENGFEEEGWDDWKDLWVTVNNLFGKEFYAAKAVNEEKTVEFKARYSNELDAINSKEYRIVWNSKIFNITFIDNIKYENKWFKIKAIEVN